MASFARILTAALALSLFAPPPAFADGAKHPLPPGIKHFQVDGKVYEVPSTATHWSAQTHFFVPGKSSLATGVTYASVPVGAKTFRGAPVPPGATHAYTSIVYTGTERPAPGAAGLLGGVPSPPSSPPIDIPAPPSAPPTREVDPPAFGPPPAVPPPGAAPPEAIPPRDVPPPSVPPSSVPPPSVPPPSVPPPTVPPPTRPTPNQIMQQRIVAVAAGEVGRYADTIGREVGVYPFDLRRYLGRNEAYCSEFVAWCYLVAGYPFTGGSERGGWMKKNTAQITSWFERKGTFVTKNSRAWRTLTPEPGDYIYYVWSSGYTHSGIVAAVVGDDLRTLEGNINKRVVALTRRNWRSSRSIRGIGRMGPIFASHTPPGPSPPRLALSNDVWAKTVSADDDRGSGHPND